ncbi:MAG: PAS domain S-box protein [Deltaproteobacteria bacterium]|nr:PAS domain S-box protein [Deltaproteobacteria bacterium]
MPEEVTVTQDILLELLENINVGVYRSTSGAGGRFLYANRAMATMFGYDSIADLLSITVSDLYVRPEDRQRFVDFVSQKGEVMQAEMEMKKKDGALVWMSLCVVAQYDPNRRLKWMDGVIEDITRRKNMEEELAKSRTLESLGILGGGIAHDFNNSLASIVACVSLVAGELGKDHPRTPVLEWVLELCEKSAVMARKLIVFSKSELPGRKEKKTTDTLIRQAVAKCSLKGISGIKIIIDTADDAGHVEINEEQFNEVIRNMIINAIEAIEERRKMFSGVSKNEDGDGFDGGRISISAENAFMPEDNIFSIPAGQYVKFCMEDNGIGIPKAFLLKVFYPYFTTRPAKNTKSKGLGLAYCYAVVKKHGGAATVESEEGKGAKFIFYLPAVG